MGRAWIRASSLLAGLCALAAPAHAVDKFKVTSIDCDMYWLWKRTPVVHYEIVDERVADYAHNPPGDYFAQAAARTAAFCERTSGGKQQALGPSRRIVGVWFQSNDDMFKALYNLDQNGVDGSAGTVNRIADKYAADQAADAQHRAKVEQVRTSEARAQDLKAAQQKAEQDKVAARATREAAFYARPDVQRARLGTTVGPNNFASVDDVRVNPWHYKRLGVAVVRTAFNKMVDGSTAMFGNELAPVFLHVRDEDVDRFTKSGEVVMLAFRPLERGDVERSYGSVPEVIISAIKQEPLFGEYVGAYTCPGDRSDCDRIFDLPPA